MDTPVARITLDPTPVWRYFRGTQSGHWIAVCDLLKQTVSGTDFPEMVACVAEAMESLIQDLLEEGDLDIYMERHGVTVENLDVPECDSHYELVIDSCWDLEPER